MTPQQPARFGLVTWAVNTWLSVITTALWLAVTAGVVMWTTPLGANMPQPSLPLRIVFFPALVLSIVALAVSITQWRKERRCPIPLRYWPF